MKKWYFFIFILLSSNIFGQAFLFKKHASAGFGLSYSVSDFKKNEYEQERLEMIGISGFVGIDGKFDLGFAYGKVKRSQIQALSLSVSFYNKNKKNKDIINYMSFFITHIPNVKVNNYDFYNSYAYSSTKSYQTVGFSFGGFKSINGNSSSQPLLYLGAQFTTGITIQTSTTSIVPAAKAIFSLPIVDSRKPENPLSYLLFAAEIGYDVKNKLSIFAFSLGFAF
jgi:hypothetical protein